MEDLLRAFPGLRSMTAGQVGIAVVDILLVAYIIYRLLMLVQGTRAWRIIIGLIIFMAVWWVSDLVGLKTLHWLLDRATLLGPVALVILFLPELRQTIEGLGKLGRWTQAIGVTPDPRAEAKTVEEMVAAVAELSAGSIGALIVIEKSALLDDIAANGVLLNAVISAPLIVSIFYEKNPLHDGAVIIRGDKILAAACRLPLSESSRLDPSLHMRHRAAVGVTESLDCLSIVVSEERGTISVASEGRLRRLSSPLDLRELLNRELRNEGIRDHRARKPRARRTEVGVERK